VELYCIHYRVKQLEQGPGLWAEPSRNGVGDETAVGSSARVTFTALNVDDSSMFHVFMCGFRLMVLFWSELI
jgi:hypothetical protein